MAATVSNPQVSMQIQASLAAPAVGASTTNSTINQASSCTFTVGGGTGNVNKTYDAVVTIASTGSPTSIDLTSVTDLQGNAITFAAVSAIMATCISTTPTDSLTVGGGTNGLLANASNAIFPVQPTVSGVVQSPTGSGYCYSPGNLNALTVDSTHKIITLTALSGTSIPARITVLGK